MKKYNNILTKEILIEEYVVNKRHSTQIAKKYNTNSTTIFNYLKKFNIKSRTLSEAKTLPVPKCVDCNKFLYDRRNKRCTKCNYTHREQVGFNRGSKNGMYDCKGKLNPNWHGGLSKRGYPIEFSSELKLKIRKRDDFTCQKCNREEKEHKLLFGCVLSIHHIDYDKQNCKEENLVTLCNLCNIKVNCNRIYWTDLFTKLIRGIK